MDHFAYSWLAIQCKIIGECHCALLLMVKPDSQILSPIAQWPADIKDPPVHLLTVAQSALQTRQNVITQNIPDTNDASLAHDYLAVPIVINTKIAGVVVLKIDRRRIHSTQEIFSLLEQGLVWLELGGTERRIEFSKEFYATVVKLAATCLEQPSYREALIALISEINKHFLCERVAIGIIKHKHAEIIAFSNSTKFDKRANLMRCIADAMDEAVDQDTMIIYPGTFCPRQFYRVQNH